MKNFPHSDKMESSITTDITQMSEIPKFMGSLFLLVTFKQKQTCPVRLNIKLIQPQHYTNLEACSTRGLVVSNHNFDQN